MKEEKEDLIVSILNEFQEICENYYPDSPHVYGEAIAFTPQVLGYPENMAISILSHLGFQVDNQ